MLAAVIATRRSFIVNDVYAPANLRGLPGLYFDLQFPGDNVWLRIERLEETRAPVSADNKYSSLIRVSDNLGKFPTVAEQALLQFIREQQDRNPEGDIAAVEAQVREDAATALSAYIVQWQQWAEVEKPRRKTISLYGDSRDI